ncbi:class I SAM-dependent methyltransferase [Actinomadura parmotrematis]|uniref:Class I SAM-dependent methyltransferase n=1 Tax=Actinomadura parmotrematis TaxID=2864039 RepID=A0ABS7G5R3_9ACTN|nr:class I SAM-dependent methyltransferase [Actinomadura parmotrematis]MBW8486983.1 class I SAM-dependent methyltransferase [Actinomadura parmotrematis]
MTGSTPGTPRTLEDVDGWFGRPDQRLFTWFLERQDRLDQRGDLLELGTYLGRSAVLIGRHVRADERLTVCDLFGSPAPDEANDREVTRCYPGLTRADFERTYLAFHDRPPVVVQAPTSVISDYLRPGRCRFAHVDASHLYEHMAADLAVARSALAPEGIVVCDGHRAVHAPGAAAAVWTALDSGGLRPICATPSKLYGTWGDPDAVRDELLAFLAGADDLVHETCRIAEYDVPFLRARDEEPDGLSAEDAAEVRDAVQRAVTAEVAAGRAVEHAEAAEQRAEELAEVAAAAEIEAAQTIGRAVKAEERAERAEELATAEAARAAAAEERAAAAEERTATADTRIAAAEELAATAEERAAAADARAVAAEERAAAAEAEREALVRARTESETSLRQAAERTAEAEAEAKLQEEGRELAETALRAATEQHARLTSEAGRLRDNLDAARREVIRLKGQLRRTRMQLRAIRNSRSFRMGRALTATPRAMRRMTGGS